MAIDNLPQSLLKPILMPVKAGEAVPLPEKLVISVDVRSRDFSPRDLIELLTEFRRESSLTLTFLFLDCRNAVLERRFTETRRRHPLALDRPVHDGIVRERELLDALAERADITIDTSEYAVADLRNALKAHVADDAQGLTLCVTSFAYPKGVPRDADLVLDVRFLRNPHYDEQLRPLTGRQSDVAEYIRQDPGFDTFWAHLTALLKDLLPRYAEEGKSYLTIAFGCTGGKHRSVFMAEACAAWLQSNEYDAIIRHRDMPIAEVEVT